MSTVTTPAPAVPIRSAGAGTRLWGLIAEFDNPAQIVAAAERVRDAGYALWDCHTPFPVHGLDAAMGIRRTILPVLVFMAGLTGATLALALQVFTNGTSLSIWALVWVTGYPFLISGKPLWSIPAFIPVMFELTVLFSAMTTAGGMFLLNGLPRLFHPLFTNRRFLRATDDRFFISIDARDPNFLRSRTEALLKSLGARTVEAVEE
ncbi:MAG: DUF3341 domain-containing protein [Phycisphaeraceae bacterium]|nr:DUF3341 domain-containing protein [Phycisphaeraceae bacterium]